VFAHKLVLLTFMPTCRSPLGKIPIFPQNNSTISQQDKVVPNRRFTTGNLPAKETSPATPSSVQLSQDEVVHIRSVLNRAKMEEVDDSLRTDIESGKVCFRCTKVRFNLLNWKYHCRLCRNSFCSACSVKVCHDAKGNYFAELLSYFFIYWKKSSIIHIQFFY
jgi:FYVE zinc finger